MASTRPPVAFGQKRPRFGPQTFHGWARPNTYEISRKQAKNGRFSLPNIDFSYHRTSRAVRQGTCRVGSPNVPRVGAVESLRKQLKTGVFPLFQPPVPSPPTIPEGHTPYPGVLGIFGLQSAQNLEEAREACDIQFSHTFA